MSSIKFSLATNFSDDLVEGIKPFSDVYELYGRMKDDIFCGGRPNNASQDVEKKLFEKHVTLVRKLGVNFNYLFNGTCLSNKEQDPNWQKKLISFLEYLTSVGVNAVTLTNPLVLQLIKKHFPDIICRISTFCCIDTPDKAYRWEELGADIICLDFVKINRRFDILKQTQKILKKSKIELLATNSCIKDCPFIHTHINNIAHASDISHQNGQLYVDWCLHKCQLMELQNPAEYIRSPWIRPEDLHYYEKIGIEHIKLTERGFPTEILLKRLTAYHNRSYDGNLLDLIQAHGYVLNGTKTLPLKQKQKFSDISQILDEIFKIRGFKQSRKYPPHVFIDNKKLGDFLSFFVKGHCKGDCLHCSYCNNISKQVITSNKEISDYLINLYKQYENKLIT